MAKLYAHDKSSYQLIPFGRAVPEATKQKNEPLSFYEYEAFITQAKADTPFTKRQLVLLEESKAVIDTSSTTATQRQGY